MGLRAEMKQLRELVAADEIEQHRPCGPVRVVDDKSGQQWEVFGTDFRVWLPPEDDDA